MQQAHHIDPHRSSIVVNSVKLLHHLQYLTILEEWLKLSGKKKMFERIHI